MRYSIHIILNFKFLIWMIFEWSFIWDNNSWILRLKMILRIVLRLHNRHTKCLIVINYTSLLLITTSLHLLTLILRYNIMIFFMIYQINFIWRFLRRFRIHLHYITIFLYHIDIKTWFIRCFWIFFNHFNHIMHHVLSVIFRWC